MYLNSNIHVSLKKLYLKLDTRNEFMNLIYYRLDGTYVPSP